LAGSEFRFLSGGGPRCGSRWLPCSCWPPLLTGAGAGPTWFAWFHRSFPGRSCWSLSRESSKSWGRLASWSRQSRHLPAFLCRCFCWPFFRQTFTRRAGGLRLPVVRWPRLLLAPPCSSSSSWPQSLSSSLACGERYALGLARRPPPAARAPEVAPPRAESAPDARYRQGRGSAWSPWRGCKPKPSKFLISPSSPVLDRARCVFTPNFPENGPVRESRRALTTGIRGSRAIGGRSPSVLFGKVGRNDLLNGRNRWRRARIGGVKNFEGLGVEPQSKRRIQDSSWMTRATIRRVQGAMKWDG